MFTSPPGFGRATVKSIAPNVWRVASVSRSAYSLEIAPPSLASFASSLSAAAKESVKLFNTAPICESEEPYEWGEMTTQHVKERMGRKEGLENVTHQVVHV